MSRVILILIFSAVLSYGQESRDYYIAAEGGIGISRFLSNLSLEGLNKNGLSLSLAFYWHPEHLLEAGIETGYQYLYSYSADEETVSYGSSKASASLTSLPVLIVFRMRIINNIRLQAGSGIILLYNQGEAFSEKFSSSQPSTVDYIGLSYTYSLTEKLMIGGSFKYNYIFKGEESFITLQFNAGYKLLEW